MSLQDVSRAIRALPYADMVQLAAEVARNLRPNPHETADATDVADALIMAATETQIEPSELTKQENRILAQIFSRKRQIVVEKQKAGWLLAVPTLNASVMGTDLRTLLPMLIDQITTLHVMKS